MESNNLDQIYSRIQQGTASPQEEINYGIADVSTLDPIQLYHAPQNLIESTETPTYVSKKRPREEVEPIASKRAKNVLPVFDKYWNQLHPELHVAILNTLMSDPMTLKNLCLTSTYMYNTCRDLLVQDNTIPNKPRIISILEYLSTFQGRNDIKKCLLYLWVAYLVETSDPHWLNNPADEFGSGVLEEKFESLNLDIEEPSGLRYLVGENVDSIMNLVPYDRVSRNDLLLFASSTFPRILSNPVFQNMIEDREHSNLFWNTLATTDLFEQFDFPEQITIVDGEPMNIHQFKLGTAYDMSRIRTESVETEKSSIVFPMYGTNTNIRTVQYLSYFAHMWWSYLLPDTNLNGLTDQELYQLFTSELLLQKIKKTLNTLIRRKLSNPNTAYSGVNHCSGVDFFDVFNVALYINPVLLGGWWSFDLLGIVVPKPQDISPIGRNYWQ